MKSNPNSFHEECIVVDMHCHPSLKMKLFERKFWQEDPQDHPEKSEDFDPFTTQVTFPKMEKGGVDVIFSSIYVPEKGFYENSCTVPIVYPILKKALPKLIAGLERQDKNERAFIQTLEVKNQFEKIIEDMQKEGSKVRIAKSYSEVETGLQNGEKIILHAIEGAHSLGRNYGSYKPYLDNLQKLFDGGVCLITLGHFFPNDVVNPTFGFPKQLGYMLALTTPGEYTTKLGNIGVKVVERMLELGMLVDLVHSNPVARAHIFEINDALGNGKRPLVLSHTGTRFYYDKGLNISDEEILKIQECEGTIGIILNNYWLHGSEKGSGVEHFIRTVRHIHEVTKTYDNISIGTDYDGFTDPPDDILDYNSMPLLTKALLERGKNEKEGMSEDDIKKVMGGNAMRVLKKGWGKQ